MNIVDKRFPAFGIFQFCEFQLISFSHNSIFLLSPIFRHFHFRLVADQLAKEEKTNWKILKFPNKRDFSVDYCELIESKALTLIWSNKFFIFVSSPSSVLLHFSFHFRLLAFAAAVPSMMRAEQRSQTANSLETFDANITQREIRCWWRWTQWNANACETKTNDNSTKGKRKKMIFLLSSSVRSLFTSRKKGQIDLTRLKIKFR